MDNLVQWNSSMALMSPTISKTGTPFAMNILYYYDDTQKSVRFPNYCIPDVKDVVKLLPGYLARDWTQWQSDVKQLYWQYDKLRNTRAALNELIRTSRKDFDLNVYFLRYTSITDALIKQHALSPIERITRLLDGLPDDLRRKVS
jgi:hypothetical protein